MFNNKKITYIKIESEVKEDLRPTKTESPSVETVKDESTVGAMLLDHIFASSEKRALEEKETNSSQENDFSGYSSSESLSNNNEPLS